MNDESIEKVINFVKQSMIGNDSSHDWLHIERVCNNSQKIGKKEGLGEEELKIVFLAAVLHDLKDWKYHGTDIKKGRQGAAVEVEQCLFQNGFPEHIVDTICYVVANVGFSKELEKKSAEKKENVDERWTKMLHVVSDADQLDALGAIGIARCLTFGATKGRSIYDHTTPVRDLSTMTAEEYRLGKTTTMNHFPEKLFYLKDRMKTNAGKMFAEDRDSFMHLFYDQFQKEISE